VRKGWSEGEVGHNSEYERRWAEISSRISACGVYFEDFKWRQSATTDADKP
jgi:hypothetical protein